MAVSASSLFATTDYVIQITEKDGTVRDIPVSSLEKVTFEPATPTLELDDAQKIMEKKLQGETIKATQYKLSAEDAEKLLQQYNAKSVNHKHRS